MNQDYRLNILLMFVMPVFHALFIDPTTDMPWLSESLIEAFNFGYHPLDPTTQTHAHPRSRFLRTSENIVCTRLP